MDLLSHTWQFRWEEMTVAVTGTMAPWQHLKDGAGVALSLYSGTEVDYLSE